MKLIYEGSQKNLLKNPCNRNMKIKKNLFNRVFITGEHSNNEIVV
jgi:hypothetical protein